jgi:hypothetical protein
MFADKDLRCDCGYRLRGRTEELQVAEVRRHASEAHAISFSAEEALAVLLRLELDGGVSADLTVVEEATPRRSMNEPAARSSPRRTRPQGSASHGRAEPVEARRAADNHPIQRGVDR